MRGGLTAVAVAGVLGLMAAGCAGAGGGGRASAAKPDIAFEYLGAGGENEIDQVMGISNGEDVALAPTLAYSPLDESGDRLDGVEVRAAYGSDRGELVVPAGIGFAEVLSFSGPRKRDVADVAVKVVDAGRLEGDYEHEMPGLRVCARGDCSVKYGTFDRYELTNTEDFPVTGRLIVIEYEDPPPGETQQWIRVVDVAGRVRMEPGETVRQRVPAEQRGMYGSIKPFYSP